MVLDGAGWHKSKDLVIPDGMERLFLPPYCPERKLGSRHWGMIRKF